MSGNPANSREDHAGVPDHGGSDPQFSAVLSMVYVTAIFVLATLPTLTAPAMLAGWKARFGWGDAQLGLLAAADLAGLALGGASGIYWQKRWPWRIVLTLTLGATVVLNLACLILVGFWSTWVMRLLAGTGAGVLSAVYSAYLAHSKAPERFIAATTFAQIALQGAALVVFGQVQPDQSLPVAFITAALPLAVLIPFYRLLPVGWPQDEASFADEGQAALPVRKRYGLVLLAAFVPLDFFLAIYPFLPEFGRAFAGLDMSRATYLLGLSLFPSAIGPFAAFLLGERFGVLKPLIVGAGLCCFILGLMASGRYSPVAYLYLVSALQAGWCFVNCYFYAAIIEGENRLTVATTPVAALSTAGGATMMGMALEYGGARLLGIAAIGSLAVATVMTVWALAKARQFRRAGGNTLH